MLLETKGMVCIWIIECWLIIKMFHVQTSGLEPSCCKQPKMAAVLLYSLSHVRLQGTAMPCETDARQVVNKHFCRTSKKRHHKFFQFSSIEQYPLLYFLQTHNQPVCMQAYPGDNPMRIERVFLIQLCHTNLWNSSCPCSINSLKHLSNLEKKAKAPKYLVLRPLLALLP